MGQVELGRERRSTGLAGRNRHDRIGRQPLGQPDDRAEGQVSEPAALDPALNDQGGLLAARDGDDDLEHLYRALGVEAELEVLDAGTQRRQRVDPPYPGPARDLSAGRCQPEARHHHGEQGEVGPAQPDARLSHLHSHRKRSP